MRITKQAKQDAKGLFQACVVKGDLDEDRARKAVKALVEKKPRGYLAVLSYFKHLVELDVASRSGVVESASKLDDKQKDDVQKSLTKVYGKNVAVDFKVNADLIGGLRVKVGSDVYDGSLRTRLAILAEKF